MKSINTASVFSLVLLLSAASKVVAAPAPVSSLDGSRAAVKRLERQFATRNQVQITMQNQLASLLKEVDELRGKLEKSNHELRLMNERQRDLYKEIETLKKNKPVAEAVKNTKTNHQSAAYSESSAENTAYNAAVEQILKKKDLKGAIISFESFIKKYPKSVYAPDVYFWLGQLNVAKGDLSQAKKYFTQVTHYHSSSKKPEALLKLGSIATREDNKAAADKFYQQIMSEFPNTASAKEAQTLLK